MKKFISLFLVFVLIFGLTSCSYKMKEFQKNFIYQDPQTIGGTWTISFPNGDVYKGSKCIYWGTTDDTSVWELLNGKILIQSGTVHAIQE